MSTRRTVSWIAVATLVAVVAAVPALANDDEGKNHWRWDPTGTYINVIDKTEAAEGIPEGTVFVEQVVRADRLGNYYLARSERINNTGPGGFSVFTAELRRAGPNSFAVTMLVFIVDEDTNISTPVIGTAILVREENGEVWTRDTHYSYYYPWQNPLDPTQLPFLVVPGADQKRDGMLGSVPPPALED